MRAWISGASQRWGTLEARRRAWRRWRKSVLATARGAGGPPSGLYTICHPMPNQISDCITDTVCVLGVPR